MSTDTALVIEALRARAAQRERAGGLLSAQLSAERAAGKDIRSRSVKVIDELAAATNLGRIAAALEDGSITLGVRPLMAVVTDATGNAHGEPVDPESSMAGQTVEVDGMSFDLVLPDHMDGGDEPDVELIEVDLG